jgi:hypothetical protein
MELQKNIGIRNRFDIEVYDTVTEETAHYQATNIVLDAMWDRLVNFNTYFVNIHYGTGTGTFASSRTSLFTYKGTRTATTHETVKALPTSRWVRRIVLNPEEEVGTTFTEVGVAYSATASHLVTHAAIADSEGNPITLTKTSTQVLTIYATIYIELGAEMYGGKVIWVQPLTNNELLSYLMGSSYPTQQFRVGQARSLGDGVVNASLGQSGNIGVADWIKDVANKKVTTPVTRLGTTIGNGDIFEIGVGSSNTTGTFKGVTPITGAFTDYGITGDTLGTGDGENNGFNLSKTNYKNGSESIFIDGVLKTRDLDYVIMPLRREDVVPRPFGQFPVTTDIEADNSIGSAFDGNATTYFYAFDVAYPKHIVIDFIDNKKWNIEQLRFITSDSTRYIGETKIQTSNDGVSWLDVATVTFTQTTAWQERDFTSPESAFRYLRLLVLSGSATLRINEIEVIAKADQIQFTTPPALGAAITADYTVDYIPKDSNHVLDLQCSIQYGEPT